VRNSVATKDHRGKAASDNREKKTGCDSVLHPEDPQSKIAPCLTNKRNDETGPHQAGLSPANCNGRTTKRCRRVPAAVVHEQRRFHVVKRLSIDERDVRMIGGERARRFGLAAEIDGRPRGSSAVPSNRSFPNSVATRAAALAVAVPEALSPSSIAIRKIRARLGRAEASSRAG